MVYDLDGLPGDRYRADTQSGKVGEIRDSIAGQIFVYFLSTTFPKNYSMSSG